MISTVGTINRALSFERYSDTHDITHWIVNPVLWFNRLADDGFLHGYRVGIRGVVFQPAGRGTVGTESIRREVT